MVWRARLSIPSLLAEYDERRIISIFAAVNCGIAILIICDRCFAMTRLTNYGVQVRSNWIAFVSRGLVGIGSESSVPNPVAPRWHVA